jgi:hypothetical protein
MQIYPMGVHDGSPMHACSSTPQCQSMMFVWLMYDAMNSMCQV